MAPFRAPDGSLHIPGNALTPELQRLLFSGANPQPFLNLSRYVPAPSPYPTAYLLPQGYETPNPNVFVHPRAQTVSLAGGIAQFIGRWFPPIDWSAAMRGAMAWFFGLFTWDARAAVTVDSTTASTVPIQATCTTTQTASAGDNAVLVLLSERGTVAYATVTYGTISLALIANTAVNSGTSDRTEIWFFQGAVPTTSQTMTATLSGGNTQRQVCATVLLAGVSTTSPTTGGTTATGTTTNPTISIAPASGELAFAVLGLWSNAGASPPTAVTGTGAAATDLYGVAVAYCSGGGSSICGAGASLPAPGTGITWTGSANNWAVSAVRVTPAGCGTGGQNCYRIGAGGAWSSTSNWSSSSGGGSCSCTPAATDQVFFDANASGTTSLAAATTVASINMAGFPGTLDTTASNWALTINGPFSIQGTFLARTSAITVTGNVSILTAASVVNLGGSAWTVNGTWTNASTSASWSAGTGVVVFNAGASRTMIFGALPASEFNNVQFNPTAPATFTMATNGMRWGGTLTLNNNATMATAGLALTGGNLTVNNGATLNAGGSAVGVANVTMTGGTSGTITLTTGTWAVSGAWTTSGAGSTFTRGTSTVTLSGAAQTVTVLNAANGFYNLTVSGTIAQGSAVDVTGTLSITGTLTTSNNTITGGSNLVVAATGTLSAGSSSISIGSMNTAAAGATFSVGTSTVIVVLSGGTINVPQTLYNFTVNPTVTTNVTSNLSWSGTLTLTSSTTTFSGNLTSSGTGANTLFGSATVAITGNWDTSSVTTGGFTATSSTVTFSGAAKTIRAAGSQSFAAVSISGSISQLSPLVTAGALSVTTGASLTTSNNALSVQGALTLLGTGFLAAGISTVSVGGNLSVTAATAYITAGAGVWTVGGSWTDASTSASWSFLAAITFNAATSQTMTFGNLTPEFGGNITFNSAANTTTFTLSTNPLRWGGTLTVLGGTGTTTLTTANLGLTGGALTIGNAGVLTANASTVSVSGVTMTGGSSGSLTLTTGAWTVTGSWNTSGAGSALASGTSTVTFTGTSTTLTLAPAQAFYNLTINGTVAIGSTVTAQATLTVNPGAALTKTGQSLAFNGLTENGTGSLVDGTVTVVGLTIANSDPTNVTTISVVSIWSANTEYNWTDSSTVGTSTLTFTIGGNASGNRFNVSKNGSAFTTGIVNASGQVVFTMLGSDPVVDVLVLSPCGSTRYWIGGTGNWSQTARWGSVSGGVGGCPIPAAGDSVFFDGNAGGGLVSVDQNAMLGSLDTTGWTGTIAVGTYDFAVSGNLVLAAGVVTIGASTTNGLTAGGNLTLSGSAVLDGSGTASKVSVSGNVIISSATAYFRMGSGTWSFGGAWTNGSTSASWVAGTGAVLFSAPASQTMTFANLPVSEFYNVTFASTAGTGAIVFTMATNRIAWGNLLTIQDAAGSTTTVATANLGLAGGSLNVGNGGILSANASVASVLNVTMTGGSSGTITMTTGAWTVAGSWDTSGTGSSFAKGSGAVTMTGPAATVKTLDAAHGFYNLTVSGTVTQAGAMDVSAALAITGRLTTAGNDLTGGSALTISGGGALVASTSSVSVAGVTMNDAAADTLSLTTGSLIVSGPWDTSGASSVFTAGTSTVTLTAAAGTLRLGAAQSFANLVLTGSYAQMSALTASSVTISSGGLAKGTNTLTVNGDLILSGGTLTSVSGDVAISGNVDVSSPASYIAFGSEAWRVSGGWTNASTSASWSVGTGTVTFDAGSSQTMTFAGSNLSGLEFNAVVFNGGGSTVTFTVAGSALRAHSITIQGGPGTTTLDTSSSNVSITTDSLTVAAGGTLQARGSVVTMRTMDSSAGTFLAATSVVVVNASGGVLRIPQVLHSLTVNPGISTTFGSNIAWSGILTLTGATVAVGGNLTASGAAGLTFGGAVLSVAGSWDSSSAIMFGSAGSSVTLTGAGQTIALGSGQAFAALTIAGSLTLTTDLSAATLTVASGSSLTKTNHAIAFNALTVNGTIVDGPAIVSNLTVTNSDATAFLTISVFTTWTVGAEYAWTHTSSESSQTITWTIGGNTARFLYHVTKNGSAFATGTVDDSGHVVFSMLGSDPDMRVTVSAPPVPAWWQSSYFLAIPPVAFLMVVAMFVQRRRWRPAKAFLVDERAQLLREFTLDPSCEVTYDQALQAGALDAVDKDVRVSKYHARAVHGDTLSLIMLAVGPANVEEVEFARGILVSIQDKLEDRVKQRLDEARAEEATLETAHAQASEERADLQARARVFGDLLDGFTVAQSKLDADSQRLHGLDTDLGERENRVAQERAVLDAQTSELNAKRTELERTASDLAARESQAQEADRGLREREEQLSPQETALGEREAGISQREAEVADRQGALASAQTQLARDLEDYRVKAQRADALQAELAEERKALDDLNIQIDERERTLETKTAAVDAREKEVTANSEAVQAKIAGLEPREQDLQARESQIASSEATLAQKAEVLSTREQELRALVDNLHAREASLSTRAEELEEERKALDELTQSSAAERRALEAKETDLVAREADVAQRTQDLTDLKENLGPREATLLQKEEGLAAREKGLADEESAFQSRQDLVAAKALEIEQQMETLRESEAALSQEKILLQDGKGAVEAQRQELEARKADFAREMQHHKDDLAAQGRTLGEARLRLSKDGEAFEAQRLEKSQWIASKEIELEAKEQSLADREAEIRAQAEENARRLAELATREESLEIEGDKLDKARAEFETRKAELGAMGRDLEAKTARFREEEARKGEELRTWQATLESEQALLKEQKETFEKEMQDLRESWAGRMIRIEQREDELQGREGKVQTDIEWVARNEADLTKRETAAKESMKAAGDLKAEGERLRLELEQRSMEIESRERNLREEAAEQSVILEKRTEALQAEEAELAGRRAQWERELATQTQKIKDREGDLQTRNKQLDAREAELASREAVLLSQQSTLRQDEDRLARERADLQAMEKQVESKQLELGQGRERLDAESLRLRTEADAVRQSLAAKEADLTSERERLERESSVLQDKLGAKAREMAAREKDVAAREEELRAEEQDLDARTREIESRERQADAHQAELTAREGAFTQGEAEQKARHAAFDETVRTFEAEAAARQKEWKDLQATLKSQEQQLAASAETRQAEIRKRMEDLEQREHSLNATLTQAQIERTRLEAQAKAQGTRQTEIEAAGARSDKRFVELKTMEEELLKSRQGFEAEKAGWSSRRSEELKQLEATRDAAAEQTQQSERLIEDAQRRTYVAAEAEKAAKRQAEELAVAQTVLESRRADAEKAEKAQEAQTAQLRDASQRLGAKELELESRAKELHALQARLAEAEKRSAETSETLKGRKASLDQEAERIAALAAQLDKRQAEIETHHSAVETKLADVTNREQVLSTELQRADNLMEDLNRKEAELLAREKGLTGHQQELAKREQMLALRDSELRDGMQTLERLRRDQEAQAAEADDDRRRAAEARKEGETIRSDAEKLRAQADAMQAEVAKNMRFLQKKALDVLDREEKLRTREATMDEQNRLLESRAQILEQKDRAFEAEKEEMATRLEKAKLENEKIKVRLAEAEKASKSTIDMDEWKRDIDNRVKIIQKKALDLLDREEKLRKKEEELRALAVQLGVEAKA
ncbi:MAG TPA: hypothetical protein VEY12_05680 [Thermoplasmata archaeon]|nr:hypothetical protein [Thermoplasmata archaeon]